MELSVKKITRAIDGWLKRNNGYGHDLQFDIESDNTWDYMVVRSVYAIRIPKSLTGERVRKSQGRFVHMEPMMEEVLEGGVPFEYVGLTTIRGDKEVCEFRTAEGTIKYVDSKFFKEFYNRPIMKEVPDNISFIGAVSNKYPLLMFEDDDCIAMFCPIVPN